MHGAKNIKLIVILSSHLCLGLQSGHFPSVLPTKITNAFLTNSVQQSPSREANMSSASQDIPPHFMKPESSLSHSKLSPTLPILSQINPGHASPPHPTSWRSILILFFHACLGLPNGLFHSGLLTKTLYAPLHSTMRATRPPISFFLIDNTNDIWWRSFSASSLLHFPSYLAPLSSKYLSQHPIPETLQPMLLPQSFKPSFTLIQNNRQHYTALCILTL